MKAKDVPQQDSILEGHRRACYAVDDSGRYGVVASKGWEVESIVNGVANADLRELLEAVRQRVLAGAASPLEYHMQRCQMTPAMLAAEMGMWGWRVRRHLRPEHFSTLGSALLARYADALRISVEELQRVPAQALETAR
jgi:hypothetical protein